jgi:FlaA1/EpsC-like NDP-sugar epimerase
LSVSQAIIAMPEASHTARRRVMEFCNHAALKVLTVPSFDDLVSGRVTVSQIRHVELDDLLGRDPVTLDAAGMQSWLAGRVVMVTGAGGSIGSELARQIARFSPRSLLLFELNEFALYTIEQEFAATHPRLSVVPIIGDVKDATRVEHVLRAHRPSVIFHAAAYKHVPLMEQENAWQAVLNNVAGTLVVARAGAAAGVEKLVYVSTDKAVKPTSVMGASKRLAEMVCQALQRPDGTRFVMVRFGNVLGSTGSVIPKFREQIAKGGPVTVTDPQVTRYFMSIPEAVQLVMQAGLMGKGGEIFVLDMGEPVRIADLARDLIRLSGFSEEEIRIVYTGLRPGEKLYEEPLAGDENLLPTPHAKLKIARAHQEDSDWLPRLESWLGGQRPAEDARVRSELAKWVPDYSPR